MKVQPMNQNNQVTPQTTMSNSAQDARARAIAKLTAQPQAQTTAVANPNQVSPEEMSAIVPPSKSQIDENSNKNGTNETTKVAEDTKPADDLQSKQVAALARREKALRAQAQKQEQALKAREAELAAKEAEITRKLQSFDETKYISIDRFKQDPLTVMQETGLSYDQLVEKLMNQTPVDPRINAQMSKLEQEIQRLRQENEDSKKTQQTQQQEAYNKAVNQIRTDTTKLVESNPEFETIKATNSVEDVVELIKETYDKDGYLMTVEEAAQEVENYLVEEAIKLASLTKIRKRFEPAKTSAEVNTAEKQLTSNQTQEQPTMKTLTNAAASSRKLSAKERAILAFRGEKPGA